MKIKQLINNELVLGDGPKEKIINPFNSEIITEIPQSSIEQVELAVQSAKSAFTSWSQTTPADRSAMLLKVADMIEQNAEEIARIESLILEAGIEDALIRAEAYINAGADGIMIHSRHKDSSEIIQFMKKFRAKDQDTPVVVVPTSFNSVTVEEFIEMGVNVVITANHMLRAAYPAMLKVAKSVLENGRSFEAEPDCMPIKEILEFIPGTK